MGCQVSQDYIANLEPEICTVNGCEIKKGDKHRHPKFVGNIVHRH
jgi:hypothetical protein